MRDLLVDKLLPGDLLVSHLKVSNRRNQRHSCQRPKNNHLFLVPTLATSDRPSGTSSATTTARSTLLATCRLRSKHSQVPVILRRLRRGLLARCCSICRLCALPGSFSSGLSRRRRWLLPSRLVVLFKTLRRLLAKQLNSVQEIVPHLVPAGLQIAQTSNQLQKRTLSKMSSPTKTNLATNLIAVGRVDSGAMLPAEPRQRRFQLAGRR